jgi:hypothetical protein
LAITPEALARWVLIYIIDLVAFVLLTLKLRILAVADLLRVAHGSSPQSAKIVQNK